MIERKDLFSIPFYNKTQYTGSHLGMRYRIEAEGGRLQVDSAPFTATTVKVWISGGTHGARYKVTVTVTTTYERVDQSELIFTIKEI